MEQDLGTHNYDYRKHLARASKITRFKQKIQTSISKSHDETSDKSHIIVSAPILEFYASTNHVPNVNISYILKSINRSKILLVTAVIISVDIKGEAALKILVKKLIERPICQVIKSTNESRELNLFSYCLMDEIAYQQFCFLFNEGPWMKNFILNGYDPRANSESYKYQTFANVINSDSSAQNSITKPISKLFWRQLGDLKRNEVQILVRKSKRRKIPSCATGWFNKSTFLVIKGILKAL